MPAAWEPSVASPERKQSNFSSCTPNATSAKMDEKTKAEETKRVTPSERSIKIAVQIPEGESPEEWLAVNSTY